VAQNGAILLINGQDHFGSLYQFREKWCRIDFPKNLVEINTAFFAKHIIINIYFTMNPKP